MYAFLPIEWQIENNASLKHFYRITLLIAGLMHLSEAEVSIIVRFPKF